MSSVAVVGAGQLGQMLGLAGRSLGIECVYLDPSPNPPALAVGEVIERSYDDPDGLNELAARADVLTYEFENVPFDAVLKAADRIPVFPPTEALRTAQDRLEEKRLFEALEIPTAEFRSVDSDADLQHAADALGFPMMLKTRRFGYDGKGQAVIRDAGSLRDAWRRLGAVPLIAERLISFDREVSAIGARGVGGDIVTYPLTENNHVGGILRTSLAPVDDADLSTLARSFLVRLLAHFDYVGVLALELFVIGDTLLANEFAPRVHNSGHWTIEGAVTSQFENHLRAVLDLPLGDASAVGYAAMVNLIGSMPANPDVIRRHGGHLHDYGKEARPGRKLGHITLVAETVDARNRELERLRRYLDN